MKNAIIILIVGLVMLMLVSIRAQDSPFLVADPQTDVTHYEVTLDGQVETITAYDMGDGTVILRFDLGGIEMGSHHVSVKAINPYGMSTAVTKDFTAALPGAVVNMRIED